MIPDIASLHPIIVHFAIVLLIVGVLFRLMALTGKVSFASGAATTLLLVGVLAAMAAVRSGDDAHGPAERIPGARPMVQEHEEHGERARNVFLVVGLIEVVGLFLLWKQKARARKIALIGSAVAGLVGLVVLYEAAEHGGELVYSYAGGVGTRTGEPEDVGRLLLAGLYHQAQLDRREGRALDAAALFDLAAERFGDDPQVLLLHADSTLRDREQPERALSQLGEIDAEEGSSLELRVRILEADALVASGDSETALSRLQSLRERFPDSRRLERKLEEMGS